MDGRGSEGRGKMEKRREEEERGEESGENRIEDKRRERREEGRREYRGGKRDGWDQAGSGETRTDGPGGSRRARWDQA